MTENHTSYNFHVSASPAPAAESKAAIYIHPDDVANDSNLTLAEKRSVLASWISDARAVENAPALRRLDSGAVVDVDAILRVLVSLDEIGPSRSRKPLTPSPRRRSVMRKWLSRIARATRKPHDGDDDPPFAPAGFGVPVRTAFVAAHGAPVQRTRRLACAVA